jgi:hypothetical protein
MGDAMNLGWKLAATIQGKAPVGLLESYETERHPIGAQVLDWSRAQASVMRPDPAARALNGILRDLMNTRDGATYFAGRVWGVFTGYPMDGDHPLTGQMVPNFEWENGARIREWMCNGGGMLVDAGADPRLRDLAEEYGDQVNYLSGRLKNRCELSTALIRPDGILAWAADGKANLTQLRKSLDQWFVNRAPVR